MQTETALRASSLIEQLTELPAQPTAALRVLWLLDDPDASLSDLSKLIEADPALSARVMHLANSPFYGLAQQVGSALRAVTVLGAVTVRALAAASAGGLLDAGSRAVPDGFWSHAGAAAAGASVVARRVGVQASEAFSAGLLHDLGIALLYRHLPQQYETVLQFASLDEAARLDFERKVLGLNHAEAGAAVLKAWRFPETFVATVLTHHEPLDHLESPLARCVVAGEAVAACLDDRMMHEPAHDPEAALDAAGVKHANLNELVRAVEAEAEALAAFLAWE